MNRISQVLTLMLVVTTVGAVGQLLLKIGMGSAADKAPSILGIIKIMLTQPLVLCGLVLFALNTILYLRVLQQYPLSLVYPMIAFSYVVVTFLSWLVLREQIPPLRILGLGVIVLGVLIMALSGAKKSTLQSLLKPSFVKPTAHPPAEPPST